MEWNVAQIVEAARGSLIQGDLSTSIRSISTDSRKVVPGDCFVALKGERFDAHDFVTRTIAGGALAVVVSSLRREWQESGQGRTAIIQVGDTLHALGDLAATHRGRFPIPLVGIGGSNGKTSTKEMVSAILSRTRRVLKNPGNLNNLIGVPLTLLDLSEEHEAAVIEMGINVPGEMGRLAEIVRPTVGLVTNIHPAHLEGLGSLDDVLAEKGKLLTSLGSEDLAVINADDEKLAALAGRLRSRVIRFGADSPSVEVGLASRVVVKDGLSVFDLRLGSDSVSIRLPVLGMHQVQNALAAAAVAWGLGETVESIARGLGGHRPVRQRMEVHHLPRGMVLIDDTYNANPRSMVAAVRTAREAAPAAPLIVILGEMRELGPESSGLHHDVGVQIGKLGVRRLITLGELSREIGVGAREAGMLESDCCHVSTHAEAVERACEDLVRGAWIVVKGSRGMTMEKVVAGILECVVDESPNG